MRDCDRRFHFALAIFLLAALLASGAAAAETFTPAHVARTRAATSAVMSPDGTRIAYTISVPRDPFTEKDGPSFSELHVVDLEGNDRGYVTGEADVADVRWTPDGAAITFLSKRADDAWRSLYRIPIDGGEAMRLLGHGTAIQAYAPSPDGRRVAFLATEPEEDAVKQRKDRGFDRIVVEEELRPVRVWIAEIAEGGEASTPRKLELPGSASLVRWSPDGSRLALALAPTPLVDDDYMERRVHIVDAESGAILRRIENPGKLGDLAWSAKGTHLAMISAADRNDPSAGRLLAVRVEGGEPLDLLGEWDRGSVDAFAWQNDETVLFVGNEGVWTFLSEVNADGSGLKNIVPTGGDVFTSIDLAADGMSGAFLGESPAHPADVYVMKHGDSAPRRLTNVNPWLADVRLAPQVVLRYPARDGMEIEGLLIEPLDREGGKRYPLILNVHGGPESHYRNGWLTRYASAGQLGAARGFAVFYPNYRGSTGRGVAFSKLGHADAAGREFDDLVDAIDALATHGLIDPERVGITGGSYGGYASAWGATYYTDRFAASVMFVGISDLVSKMGTTDIPYEMYLVHHRKWPWDDPEYFRARSPLTYAETSRTPTLILGGKDDPRVHPSQSMELFRTLKVLGRTPVRLVQYPGEGHGNRRAASRIDYNLRMIRWMEHYLKDPGRRDAPPPPPGIDYEAALGVAEKPE